MFFYEIERWIEVHTSDFDSKLKQGFKTFTQADGPPIVTFAIEFMDPSIVSAKKFKAIINVEEIDVIKEYFFLNRELQISKKIHEIDS